MSRSHTPVPGERCPFALAAAGTSGSASSLRSATDVGHSPPAGHADSPPPGLRGSRPAGTAREGSAGIRAHTAASREMLRLRCAPLSMTGMPTPHRRGCEVPASAGMTGKQVPAFAGTTSSHFRSRSGPLSPPRRGREKGSGSPYARPAAPVPLAFSPRGRGDQAAHPRSHTPGDASTPLRSAQHDRHAARFLPSQERRASRAARFLRSRSGPLSPPRPAGSPSP